MNTLTAKKPKTYQVPKSNHPWRQYSNKKTRVTVIETKNIVPVKQFLQDMIDNWDKIEVSTNLPNLGHRKYTLSTLPQSKVAAYIAGILKRHYVQ